MIEQLLSSVKSSFNDNGYPNDLWLGEIAAANFITGPALAAAVGLTQFPQINSELGWMRFRIDGKFIWVAKRPFQYAVTWDGLNNLGIATGTKTIEIGGKTYKVRLLRGAEANPTNWTVEMGQNNPPIVGPSEWNRLMYRVSASNPGPASNWMTFTDVEIGVGDTTGGRSLCLEGSVVSQPTYCVGRGYPVIHWFNYQFRDSGGSSNFNNHGWRPVLELVA